jgi:Do/DeqQ family serine protease
MVRPVIRLGLVAGFVGVALAAVATALVPKSGLDQQSGAGVQPTQAQALEALPRLVPDNKAQVQLSFAPVVQRTSPAVVNVYGVRVEKRQQNPYMDDPFFRRFFGNEGFGVPQERVQRSLGSGVVVDKSGLIVTNHHVIAGMTEVKVAFADRREFEADIVLRDPRTDLAVIKLKNAPALMPVELGDAEALQVGDIVLAIGNPFGVGQTVTQGIVSALARTHVGVSDFQSFIQTDAAINPGNSGGALVDMSGRLVGINTAIFSKTGASHGIGFAIPSSMVKVVLESARNGGGVVRRPWFGATLQVVTPDVAETLNLDRPAGALVAALVDKGPAAAADLRRGDLILAVDGLSVDDPDGFGYRFATRALTGTAALTVLRAGKRQTILVKLMSAPETTPRDPVTLKGRSPFAGAVAVNNSPAVGDELSIDGLLKGVVLADVPEDSTAGQVGLRKGDIVMVVNGTVVDTSRDLDKVTSVRARFWEIRLNRGGQILTSIFGG